MMSAASASSQVSAAHRLSAALCPHTEQPAVATASAALRSKLTHKQTHNKPYLSADVEERVVVLVVAFKIIV